MMREETVNPSSPGTELSSQEDTHAHVQPLTEAEREIQGLVETGIAKWRTAKHQANPHGHVTAAEECEVRRCITEVERAKKGLPLLSPEIPLQGALGWEERTYLDAQQSKITEPPWKVKGLVVEGGATQVSAHPHGMKSLSWLNAALEAVALHTVWQHFEAGNVRQALFIESEDPVWMVDARIRGIAKGLRLAPNQDVPGFHYFCPGPFDLVKEEPGLRGLFQKHQPDFVVLSTLQSMLAGRDWTTQKDMQDVNASIVRLSRVCPLVVITHSPWNKKHRRAAGTITQFANFAVTLHYEKLKLSGGGTGMHVVVDSKLGTVQEGFHLQLLTEGDKDDASSVRGLVYGGSGRPKGSGKEAVIQELADDPDASNSEVAERAGVSARYVRKIREEQGKVRSER
ncbi:MAG: AAA family ATPase [Candidatus Acidiferrum sp.]